MVLNIKVRRHERLQDKSGFMINLEIRVYRNEIIEMWRTH